MGLGKTVQCIAGALMIQEGVPGPFLASVALCLHFLTGWHRFKRFTPEVRHALFYFILLSLQIFYYFVA